MIKIKIKKKADEPADTAKMTISPEDRDVAGYLADAAFDYLCEAYDTNGKSEIFDNYMETMMSAAREQKFYAMGMVCAMLKDNDCPELSYTIEELVLKEEEAIGVFVNHFIASAIACMFFDEDEEGECDFHGQGHCNM